MTTFWPTKRMSKIVPMSSGNNKKIMFCSNITMNERTVIIREIWLPVTQ